MIKYIRKMEVYFISLIKEIIVMSNTKLPPLDVIKELAGEGVELPEEILDAVAGGAYSVE